MAEEDYDSERGDYSDCPAAFGVGEMERRRGDALTLIERAG